MGVFSKAKDRVLEQMALSYLNSKWLEPYGQATSLRIDSAARAITVEVELKGETKPVRIEILDYDIRQEGDRYFAVVKEIRTSREWLTVLAREQLVKSQFELPAKVARLLMFAL